MGVYSKAVWSPTKLVTIVSESLPFETVREGASDTGVFGSSAPIWEFPRDVKELAL